MPFSQRQNFAASIFIFLAVLPIARPLFAQTVNTAHNPQNKSSAGSPAIAAYSNSTSDTSRLEHVFDIAAPVEKVWAALTTADEMKVWMTPHVEIDLRIGGLMRANYIKEGRLGDDTTIVNEIICLDPPRMIALRVVKPPASFPFPNAWLNTWSVLYFDPLPEGRTRLRIVGLGYGADEESQKMREFFDKGNTWTGKALRWHFARTAQPPAITP